jgi:membrane fusion protein, copper/silver efflux system
MKTILVYILGATLFFLGACGSGDSNSHLEHEHADAGSATYTCPMHPQIVQNEPGTCPVCHMDLVPVSKGDAASAEIMLSKSQILLGNITTQAVGTGNIGNTTVALGRLTENKESAEVISSRAAGRIEKLYVKQSGEFVAKGKPLYELYSESLLTYQREYLLAKAQYDSLGNLSDTYRRFFESARRRLLLYGLSEAQLAGLDKTRQINSSVTFLSPASGYVTEIAATEGQYVPEGGILYRLVNLSKLWVEAELYEGEAGLVRVGDEVSVKVAGFEQNTVRGRVSFISPEYRANARVFVLRVEIDNPGGQFGPGMQAQVLINTGEKEAITLPIDAVIQDAQGAHVWVQTAEGTFKPRMVQTGLENTDSIEITSGLSGQDTVVVSGAYLLYSEYILKKGGNPMAGHDHSTM